MGSLGKKPALRWMRRKTSFGSSSWVDGPPWINGIMHDNSINSMNNVISHCESIKRVKLGKWIGRILNMMMIHDIVIMTYLIVRASRGSKF